MRPTAELERVRDEAREAVIDAAPWYTCSADELDLFSDADARHIANCAPDFVEAVTDELIQARVEIKALTRVEKALINHLFRLWASSIFIPDEIDGPDGNWSERQLKRINQLTNENRVMAIIAVAHDGGEYD